MRLLPLILFIIGFLFLIIEMAGPHTGYISFAGVGLIMLAAFIDAFASGPAAVVIIFFIILILLLIIIQLRKRNVVIKNSYVLEEVGKGVIDTDEKMIGRIGLSLEDLNPEGKVNFDGIIRKVITHGKLIEKGHYVEVVGIKDKTLIVVETKK